MRHFLLLFSVVPLLLFGQEAIAQSTYVPLNKDYYHLTDRYEILHGTFSPDFHTTVKPLERKGIVRFTDSLAIDSSKLSRADLFNLSYLCNDNVEWTNGEGSDRKKPILKYFYRKKADFFHVHTKDFDLHVNPVVYFSLGRESMKDSRLFLNTRGAELRGMIDNKIGFYAFAADNQAIFPSHTDTFMTKFSAIPGEGYRKSFKKNGVDFLTARGYITFNVSKHIGVQFGHDKNFIGNGYRSLILSDFSSNYTFLKLNTRIWKLNYMNLFAEMNAGTMNIDSLRPKKYVAFHHLSINLTDHINLGLFESVAFGREEGFDLNYLNPIIFYRSVEQQLGSSDNAMLGMDYKVNFLRHFSWYGQVVLDEFLLKEIKARNGWWGNKQAFQTGLKYINAAGIKNLDLQGEVNIIRPYTYAHYNNYRNYSHYNQPLAHPMGANLKEYLGIVRYQPFPRLNLQAKAFYIQTGLDTAGSNWGSNVLLDYSKFQREYNNTIAQGVKTTIKYLSFTVSYQISHNLFADLTQVLRKTDSALDTFDSNANFTLLSLRWNVPQRLQEF